MAHENQVLAQVPTRVEEGLASENGSAANNNTEALEQRETANSSSKEVGEESITQDEEIEGRETNKSKHTKSQKGGAKGKEAPSSPKRVVTTWVKKNREGDQVEAASLSNGSLAKSSKGNKVQQSPPSSTSGDTRSQRIGSLPSYDFTFKCVERAEKRKEFYAKLEEKIRNMELEKATLEAKAKEAKEAEIKLLRKSLNFKATPMPSFYQEGAPKVEFKKIPPTKAKSPKFGRQKSVPSANSQGNDNCNDQLGWSSMDEKVSRKGLSPQRTKKPQRKTATKRPTEKSTSAKRTGDATSTHQSDHSDIDQASEPSVTESSTKPTPEECVITANATEDAASVNQPEQKNK